MGFFPAGSNFVFLGDVLRTGYGSPIGMISLVRSSFCLFKTITSGQNVTYIQNHSSGENYLKEKKHT